MFKLSLKGSKPSISLTFVGKLLTLATESYMKNSQYSKFKTNMSLIISSKPALWKNTLLYNKRVQLKTLKINSTQPSTQDIENTYNQICETLNTQHPKLKERTNQERLFERQVREFTKLNFKTSYWIGNHNVDFFFPAIKSENGGGLIVEIDGGIHFEEFKMRKDSHQGNNTHLLNLTRTAIRNEDVKISMVWSLIRKLKHCKRLDHNGIKRQERRIQLFTIANHATAQEICELYKVTKSDLSLLKIFTQPKTRHSLNNKNE